MSICPVCQSELPKPPEDVREWFRCDQCGTPLQVPSTLGKILFGLSTLVPIIVAMYLSKWFAKGSRLVLYLSEGLVAVVYAAAVRALWKTRFMNPCPCDPYSSLNLSDDRKKMRGYNSATRM
jgi:hypothetical protein